MQWPRSLFPTCCFLCLAIPAAAGGNRLAYLDENNPYYVHRDFPKLTTPMWVGEDGVEAVVILSIDDMRDSAKRDSAKYDNYLRPILQRLKQIDGRAPVSIMTCSVKPDDPQLTQWLDEGLSLEIHTVDHPCPLLHDGDLEKAKSTYDRCIDLMHEIPGNKPVAFRMPCCDSLNTVSPRFYAEIFNKTTPKGNFLSIDSSVFNVFTSDDPEIPRDLVLDAEGKERFRPYIPKNLVRNDMTFDTFVNYVENYPYPYVVNGLCWQFPCVTPSDWSAQHRHGVNNSKTVEDWKVALDITVIKQGVFPLVFHPHGWIKSEQIVELIDHAVEKHGKKVKFLTFREAAERLDENLLTGDPLRNPTASGSDYGHRLLDVNGDGHMDVVTASGGSLRTRIWSPETGEWTVSKRLNIPTTGRNGDPSPATVDLRFGILNHDHYPTVLITPRGGMLRAGDQDAMAGIWHFDGKQWALAERAQERFNGNIVVIPPDNLGFRFRDLNGDGRAEVVSFAFGGPVEEAGGAGGVKEMIAGWSDEKRSFEVLRFGFPEGANLVDASGRDAGMRFIDLNENGKLDIVFSNHERYGIWLFKDMESGWSIEVLSGKRGEKDPQDELPPIVREDGSDNGFFVHSRHLFWQNEDTAHRPDLIDRRSFDELLADVEPGPKTPEMSLRSMVPRPGFTVELMAAEPLVIDPVAFEWGPDGRLWVAEMSDYPSGIPETASPPQADDLSSANRQQATDPGQGGRIRVLEDTTGDGRYDTSTVFLDGLNFPKSLLPWNDGVLIAAAPDILYAEDTTGDGCADHVETLFTGFGEGNQQHRVNGLVRGLDNWIHCANGDSDGRIEAIETGDVVDISGRDFRFRLETGERPWRGELDPQTGRTQFGRSRDDWGNWFGGNNSNPIWHFVLADHYLRRNPHLAPPEPRVHISETPGAAPCYPASRPMQRFNDPDKLNRFTSACSPIVYRDELFGPEFAENSFVSEPVHNLVHRQVMSPQGVTFTSRRADDERESEFLASRDNWFRPTTIKTGPDGALWIADMYRLIIEHPQYIPDEMHGELDFRAGDDRGRLYRISPKGQKQRPVPRLDRMTTPQLVAALNSPSGWQRDTAQWLLVERGDERAVPLLEAVVRGQRSGARSQESEGREPGRVAPIDSHSLSRLHALCTLDGLKALKPEIVQAALADPHPGVRRHAVRLAEVVLDRSPDIGPALLELRDDPDPQVQMQLAYTLGEWHDDRAGETLAGIALRHRDDTYLAAAVLSSVGRHNLDSVLTAVLQTDDVTPPPAELVEKLVRLAASFSEEEAIVGVLDLLSNPDDRRLDRLGRTWRLTALTAVFEALNHRKIKLDSLFDPSDEQQKKVAVRLEFLVESAVKIASEPEPGLAEADRRAAIRLLGTAPANEADPDDRARIIEVLAKRLVPQEPATIQSSAASALANIADEAVPERLLSGWRTYGPALRSQALDALFSRPSWTLSLLDAVEEKQIAAVDFNAARRQQLLQSETTAIAERAARIFEGAIDADRQKVLEAYRPTLDLQGNAERGRELFGKTCAACHRMEKVGHEVGPDLAALSDKSPEGLLVAILDPNRAVESKYMNYIAVTDDGRTFSGLLEDETGNSITLLAAEGKRQTLLRNEIEELASTAKSAMPEGLEQELEPADLADIIAYLRSQ